MGIVEIRIVHCGVCWGYRDHALALAETLHERFDAKVEVVEGGLGQFDVFVGSKVVATRGENLLARIKPPRLPNSATVVAAIERYISNEPDNPDPPKDDRARGEFSPADTKRFYDRFGVRQDAQFYENVALDRLIAHANFEHAQTVFELGYGTGRLASRLFEEKLGKSARYVGIDISTTMIEIATHRLERWR